MMFTYEKYYFYVVEPTEYSLFIGASPKLHGSR